MLARVNSDINAASLGYKKLYLDLISKAITEYLAWMEKNAKSTRFFKRITHWFHGSSGKERAALLLQAINNPNKLFSEKVDAVGNTIVDSGFCQHSLRRYIFQHTNGKKENVMNVKNPISDQYFLEKTNESFINELKMLKSKNFRVEDMSYWCLTCFVCAKKTKQSTTNVDSDSVRNFYESILSSLIYQNHCHNNGGHHHYTASHHQHMTMGHHHG